MNLIIMNSRMNTWINPSIPNKFSTVQWTDSIRGTSSYSVISIRNQSEESIHEIMNPIQSVQEIEEMMQTLQLLTQYT